MTAFMADELSIKMFNHGLESVSFDTVAAANGIHIHPRLSRTLSEPTESAMAVCPPRSNVFRVLHVARANLGNATRGHQFSTSFCPALTVASLILLPSLTEYFPAGKDNAPRGKYTHPQASHRKNDFESKKRSVFPKGDPENGYESKAARERSVT
jgi:hypothetical protein